MKTSLRTFIAFALLLLACLASRAQVVNVAIYDPNSPTKTTYIRVYENEFVDTHPQFPGGERALINFINNTREYPYNAYHRRIQGRVLCSFIVKSDGTVCNVEVIRSSGDESLNREALRVIGKMPKWVPGRLNNTKVNVRCVFPIAFRL